MDRSRTRRGWLLVLLLCACARRPAEAPDAGAVPVEVAKVVRRDVTEAIEVAGTLVAPPGRDVKLGSLVVGRIAEITVSEGDNVRKGDLLVRIEDAALRAALDQARAAVREARTALEVARLKLRRAERAFEVGVAARQDVDDARAALAAAETAVRTNEASLSTAQTQLAHSEIRAPFDGQVAHVHSATGEPVDGTGAPIIEIVDATALELRAGVSPEQALRVRWDAPAELTAAGAGERRFEGRVVAVSPVADPATGLVGVRVQVQNPDRTLKGGTPARAGLTVSVHRNVLTVPRSALVPLVQGQSAPAQAAESGDTRALAVERVNADRKVERRAVVTGASDGEVVEIQSGVSEGDEVVVRGAYALPDGTVVQPIAPAPSGADGGLR